MSNAKHTPGPWDVFDEPANRGKDFDGEHVIVALGSAIIARMSGYNRAEREANARLIAAAPELLEALEDCRKQLSAWMRDHGDDIATQEAVSSARAAIAKATGEQS